MINKVEIYKVKRVDDKLLAEVVKRILSVVNPVKIVLFGSHAYGTPTRSSDLDLLVVVDDNIKSRREIASQIYGALCGILIPKDIVVATLKDIEDWKNVPSAFITTISKKGKVIYER